MAAMAWRVVTLAIVGLSLVQSLRLPAYIGSSMVLQRDMPARLYGWEMVASHVTITFLGHDYVVVPDQEGWWNATLPAQPLGGPFDITLRPAVGVAVKLTDVMFGDVVMCSGQSNMELGVIATVNQSDTLAGAALQANNIRILQVANLDSYGNVTTPQKDFTVSQAWARVSATNLPYFSALCYFYAFEMRKVDPTLIFGLVDSSWGGTTIEPWMPPESLAQCGEGSVTDTETVSVTPPLAVRMASKGMHAQAKRSASVTGVPSRHSTLFNSMIAPFIGTPIRTILWYQGESNAGNPQAYSRCFQAFILGWRGQWHAHTGGVSDPDLPFIFVQISSWPNLDNGMIANQRWAQMSALALPKVGVAVSADLGDPASPFHPIHPPWKREVARRVSIAARNVVYGDTSLSPVGPLLNKVFVDDWSASWGDYHLGFGSGVCGPGSGFLCLGLRLVFDQPVAITPSYGSQQGYPSGFELFDRSGAVFQPITLTEVSDATTVQLNATWVWLASSGRPTVLRYAWHDYPSMFLFNQLGQPVPPFNVSLV